MRYNFFHVAHRGHKLIGVCLLLESPDFEQMSNLQLENVHWWKETKTLCGGYMSK